MEVTFREYENHLKTRTRMMPKTIKGNMEFVRRVNNLAMTTTLSPITDINTIWIEKNIQLSKDLSENTKRLYMLATRHFFEFLRFKGKDCFNPTQGLAIPHNIRSDKHKVLTTQQIQILFDHCKDLREQVIIFFLYAPGLRASEATGLDVDDIDIERGVVCVRHGKGNKLRRIPFNPEKIKPIWDRYIKVYGINSGTHALCNVRGERLTYRGLIGLLFRLYELTGIKFTAHDLRHSFATHEVDKGINPFVLKDAMGHEHLATTEIYVRSSTVRMVNEFKKVDITENILLDNNVRVC